MGGVIMDQMQLDKRFHLDHEIRELMQFTFSQFGNEGMRYVVRQTESIVRGIESEELKSK